MKIKSLNAREILDSRGLPTIECHLTLDNDRRVVSSVPSGISVGMYEAHEKRDEDKNRYFGLGVLKAIKNINEKISPMFIGKEPNLQNMDQEMIDLDGKTDKSNLGSNSILAVSMALSRAQAVSENIELYQLLANLSGNKELSLPTPMFNILNGGLHASNGICFQEFMVMPLENNSFSAKLEIGIRIYQHLKSLLFNAEHVISVGDEGGFAPMFGGKNGIPDLEAFDYIVRAIEAAGISRESVGLCIDAAASHFFDFEEDSYNFHTHEVESDELIEFYETLSEKYKIHSIEDGLDQSDYGGWQGLTSKLGSKVQIVGDDLFSTNCNLISGGIKNKLANAVLIKPNQVGTVTETLNAIELCKKNNLAIVVSNRSGETLDTFIADLAVGTNSGQFKGGGLSRGERIAKYNRFLEIEQQLYS